MPGLLRVWELATPTVKSHLIMWPEIVAGICGSPGGGCQFLGTASTSQVVGEALGMSLIHSALAPSGQGVWLDMARRSARAVLALEQRGLTMQDILSQASVHNAMVTLRGFRRLHQSHHAFNRDCPCRGLAASHD